MTEADIRTAIDNAAPGSAIPMDEEFELKCARQIRNDVGNAKRLLARYGKDLMWVKEIGWFAWVGTHWSKEDGERQAHMFAHKTAQAIWTECAVLEKHEPDDDDEKKAWANNLTSHRKWARGAGNTGRLKSMLTEAAPYLMRTIDELDMNPWLFNVQNGTLNLREPEPLSKHRREDYISRISPARFNPDCRSEPFLSFLNRIMPDQSAQLFLQRYLGYCLTGSSAEQVLLLCYGHGANGKSTLCDIVGHILGDYAMSMHFSSLLHDDRRRGGEATPDIARLPGARFVLASEPEQGARFSESTVKQLTSTDPVPARHLNRDFFEFTPQFKLLLAANHKPQVRGQDDGIWRRLLLLPFDQKIPEAERDRDLTGKLKEDASGILNWMMDGARLWLERGLEIPEVIRAAVDEYRSESDPIGTFIDSCTTDEEDALTPAKELYDAYVVWCKDNAVQHFSVSAFGRRLGDRGYDPIKKGTVFRKGLVVRPEYEWRDESSMSRGRTVAGGDDIP